MAQSGIFISFEGIDGAGKSSHVGALADCFIACGRTVAVTREPGGTTLAEQLRALVLNDAMDPLSEALLVFAARRDHLLQLIEPALQRGHVVLCDRFTDSSFAYQGGGQGLDTEVLERLEQWVQRAAVTSGHVLQPDLTLWFDLPPAEAARRLVQARSPDRFEARNADFFERVRQVYALRAEAAAHRIVRIDAAAPLPQVWMQVEQVVRARGWLAGEGA